MVVQSGFGTCLIQTFFLEIISHVINLDQIRLGSQDYVSNYIWNDKAYVDGYTDEEFVKMKIAYWDLVWQNPGIFLENRVLQFLAANEMALEDGFPFVLRGHYNFENELQINNADGKFLLFRPISNTFRSICYITKTILDRSVFRWSFNFIIEVVAIIACAFRSIKRREWYELAINAGFLGLTGALFLLTPEANMMYYLGIYYLGLFYIFAWILRKYLKIDEMGVELYEESW